MAGGRLWVASNLPKVRRAGLAGDRIAERRACLERVPPDALRELPVFVLDGVVEGDALPSGHVSEDVLLRVVHQ